MPSDTAGPSGPELTNYFRNQIELHPEKYGVMGSYSMELLEAQRSEDYMFVFDQIAYRLTTSVLCGQTISETPQVQVSLPSSWFQHLKKTLADKCLVGWGTHLDSLRITKKFYPRALLLMSVLLVIRKTILRKPVQWTKVTADIHFAQRVLYPEIDAPAQMGRPVIYEDTSISWPGVQPPFGGSLQYDPSRFLNRHEIASRVYQDPTYSTAPIIVPEVTLNWLERHGVNVDQLVKRDA